MHIDRRNKQKVYKDGSSRIDVGLTGLQAEDALGAGAVAGWYTLGYMAGGNVGRDNNAQKVYDESGEPITSTGTVNDYTIQNTTQQTDAGTLKLLRWLETHPVPVRYVLPTPDPAVVQVHYHPAMQKDEGPDQISTSQGVRTLQFTLRGSDRDHVFDDVAADQSGWEESGLGGAMDSAFS